MNNKFLSTLGLARMAGKLYYGYDSVCENKQLIQSVFLSSDLSERSKRNIILVFEPKNIQPVSLNYTKNELGYAIGTKPVGIIGVADKGFAQLLSRTSEEVI